ncbi:hypothetical protein I545_5801 [Mycobacterium kansasii 662]|uniref:Uncharacterized protein n=3 Tax=Mycobacterium kansasii TaxID=1768 RepID=A0A1V3X727_MYCKA|nr:hypothetical protein MKAN_11010 [Mycobacterium kansasii ATCC 12478]EUA10426.1 hypothetical protein I545_5801 [Mycobacterium kansasii 662]KEP39231.1 hypothetical protein MKSMC1_56530 [Mycobacterium kansasii]OOK70661.1 hypothetical protein BZL30_6557 [Mycobacterium kansasii]OOK74950.1 hypothetical protein BZL29_4541 [Mycobacterium kansasii]
MSATTVGHLAAPAPAVNGKLWAAVFTAVHPPVADESGFAV